VQREFYGPKMQSAHGADMKITCALCAGVTKGCCDPPCPPCWLPCFSAPPEGLFWPLLLGAAPAVAPPVPLFCHPSCAPAGAVAGAAAGAAAFTLSERPLQSRSSAC